MRPCVSNKLSITSDVFLIVHEIELIGGWLISNTIYLCAISLVLRKAEILYAKSM